MYLNFEYNNHLGVTYFRQTRPWEAFCRDPWWLATSFYLIYTIKRTYACSVLGLIRASPRFGVLIVAMILSIAFMITDIVTVATGPPVCAGKNPYWKVRIDVSLTPPSCLTVMQLSLVFKCTADAVFLDDFKSVLDQLTARMMGNLHNAPGGKPNDYDPSVDPFAGESGQDDHSRIRSTLSSKVVQQQYPQTLSLDDKETWRRPTNSTGASDSLQMGNSSLGTGSTENHVQHIESLDNAREKRSRHRTKEWFDVIEPV